jgi:predicted O-methyltransferase YrrM
MPESSELHTIEIDDELEDFIRSHFDSSEFADRLHLHIGDAKEILASMGDVKFDLVFMDANKREYCEYYDLVFPMLEEGGFIIADNTLWDGHVVDESHLKDAQTQGIVRFNKMVAMDDRVEKVILPIRDGLTLIRKRPKCEL